MSLFYNTITNEYPRFIGDLELLGYRTGDPLPEGWASVQQSEYPRDIGENKKVVELAPVLIDSTWQQRFEILDMTDEEIEQANAPRIAKQKLIDAGLSEMEIKALLNKIIR